MVDYSSYQHLLVEKKEDGVVLVTISRPEKANAMNARLHSELARIWRDLGDDSDVRVAIVTGAGKHFSPGGDLEWVGQTLGDERSVLHLLREAGELVYSMVNLDKPIISAINGTAMGAGLAVALCADISIASERARLNDGHVLLGVAAGDHACLLWPLLCGMAKAKHYLLTGKWIEAREAERIGLVSMVVPHEQLLPTALGIARDLARGPQPAIRLTKRALNQWLRLFGLASFDYSTAVEMLGFLGQDAQAGLRSLRETKAPPPRFPSAQ